MIRAAKPSDIPSITRRWCSILEDAGLIRPDRDKVRRAVAGCISGKAALVDEHDGRVTGAVLARITERIYSHRNQATIMVWYSDKGRGFALLGRILALVRRNRSVRRVAVYWEFSYSPRLMRVLETRYGFDELQAIARGN